MTACDPELSRSLSLSIFLSVLILPFSSLCLLVLETEIKVEEAEIRWVQRGCPTFFPFFFFTWPVFCLKSQAAEGEGEQTSTFTPQTHVVLILIVSSSSNRDKRNSFHNMWTAIHHICPSGFNQVPQTNFWSAFVCLNLPAALDGDGRHVEGLPFRRAPPLGGQPGEWRTAVLVEWKNAAV